MQPSDFVSALTAASFPGSFPGLSPTTRPLKRGCLKLINIIEGIKGVVSKETVVLRRWGSSTRKFGLINGVDNVN